MAKTGFGNFDYVCQGTWRGSPHNFSITGNHSGSAFSSADAETFLTGAASPYALSFAPFLAGDGSKVVGAKYYDGVHSTPIWEAVYDTDDPAPTTLEPTGSAYASPATSSVALPLEVCVMLESEVGLSSKGKPVYCRKFLRGGPIDGLHASGQDSTWNFGSGAAAAASSMGDGSWFQTRVYISPTGKQGPNWQVLTNPGNHQVPRGRKRQSSKSQSSIIGSALRALENGSTDAARAILLAG